MTRCPQDETMHSGADVEGTDLGVQSTNLDDVHDFGFLDIVAPPTSYYSLFEMAEEMVGPVEVENYGDEPSMLRVVMKRMTYERSSQLLSMPSMGYLSA
ncbi:hypothetical protein RJT34_16414 [Clitoria ternatea]|uniref:Uncharacterized protein n=1 Tax=Clitoria ternatea TaxID=43366 RepID=A0AAN9J8F6_CLITE